jgi:hypothetical protein
MTQTQYWANPRRRQSARESNLFRVEHSKASQSAQSKWNISHSAYGGAKDEVRFQALFSPGG